MLGLEPFATEFTPSYVKEKIQNKKKPIKSLLLDQTVVCGLGNIYVDEVLYRARLHPLTSSSELTDKDIANVVKYTVEVLARAIELGGTTIRTFRSSHGVSGTFQNELLVHQRKERAVTSVTHRLRKLKWVDVDLFLSNVSEVNGEGDEVNVSRWINRWDFIWKKHSYFMVFRKGDCCFRCRSYCETTSEARKSVTV